MKSQNIRQLFTSIADKYDLLNHLLSFNLDRFWRKKLVKLSHVNGSEIILDLCTGTGDIAIEFAAKRKMVIGLDYSRKMLSIAREKIKKKRLDGKIHLIEADATKLPLKSNFFHVVTIGFGLRNIESKEKALKEMYRVLKQKGKCLILEFVPPQKNLWGKIYNFYLTKMVPLIGTLISGKKHSYNYLSNSVKGFYKPEKIMNFLESVGFTNIKMHRLTSGIVYIFIGEKG